MSHTAVLGSIPLFEGLAEEDLEALAQGLVVRRFNAGAMIFAFGRCARTEAIIRRTGLTA